MAFIKVAAECCVMKLLTLAVLITVICAIESQSSNTDRPTTLSNSLSNDYNHSSVTDVPKNQTDNKNITVQYTSSHKRQRRRSRYLDYNSYQREAEEASVYNEITQESRPKRRSHYLSSQATYDVSPTNGPESLRFSNTSKTGTDPEYQQEGIPAQDHLQELHERSAEPFYRSSPNVVNQTRVPHHNRRTHTARGRRINGRAYYNAYPSHEQQLQAQPQQYDERPAQHHNPQQSRQRHPNRQRYHNPTAQQQQHHQTGRDPHQYGSRIPSQNPSTPQENLIQDSTSRISGSQHNREEHERRVVQASEQRTTQYSRRQTEDHHRRNESFNTGSLKVGRAMNVFSRYGFLTLSIRVSSPNGGDNEMLFMENTSEIFERNSYSGRREARQHTGMFDDHFYIHFCEDLDELLTAYFDHFTIEGVEHPHKAFTSSLSTRALARLFGVNASIFNSHFSFVLVRLFRRDRRFSLRGSQEVAAPVQEALQNIEVGSSESVHKFIDRYGSHVITEFEVGDMIYQTFVFGERLYRQLRNRFAVVTSESHLAELQQYFAPSFAASVGNVMLASGNERLNHILERRTDTSERLLYPNIFKVFENDEVEAELRALQGEVVLSLKLEKITNKFPRSAATRWMSDVLDNTLMMFYHHMAFSRNSNTNTNPEDNNIY